MTNPKPKRAQRVVGAAKPNAKGAASKRGRLAKPAASKRHAATPSSTADTPAVATNLDTQPTVAKGPSGKLGIVVALMRRREGATIVQMGAATGWQPHSVRGALAGSLKRKHKLTIVGEAGGGGRVYRISTEPAA